MRARAHPFIFMKNKTKKIISGILTAVFISSGLFVFPASAATIDFDSWENEGISILQIGNSTKDSGSLDWNNNSVSADAGDEIALLVHYHNFTSGITAFNTKIKTTLPSGSSKTQNISISLWADNSTVFYDSTSVNISTSQSVSFISNSVQWYPKGQPATSLPNSQSGNEIISSGINIGSVNYGDSESGYLTFKIKISNVQPTPSPSPTPTPTPTPTPSPTPSPTPTPVSGQEAPSVSTLSAQDVNNVSATIKGSVDPNGSSATAWFLWGTSADGLINETSHQDVGSGTISLEFLSGLTGLASSTTYYYKAMAQNAFGTSQGSTRSFKTGTEQQPVLNPPSVFTNYASDITTSSATIRGSANPKGFQAYAWFEWGASADGLVNETTHQDVGNGNVSIDFLSGLSGLSANTTYFYRAVAQNDNGITRGSTRSFTTKISATDDGDNGGGGGGDGSCLPIVTTKPASFITRNSSSLRALVNPNGRSTSGWFEYGQSYALTFRTTSTHVGSGSVDTDLLRLLSDLQSNTTYYYRAVAENNCGKVQGSILSFTTEPGDGEKPVVITFPATAITQAAAALNGKVNPKGFSTVGWLEWSTDSSLNSHSVTPSVNLGAGTVEQAMSSQLGSLSNNTTYYFRAAARNDYGVSYGSILSFRTLGQGEIPYVPVSGGGGLVVWKEIKNLTFPNGTVRISASFIGDTLEYYLYVKNSQSAELKNIIVKDIIDERFEFLESDPGIDSSSSGNTLYWKIDSLKSGETKTITYRIKTKKVEESIVIPNIFRADASSASDVSNEATTILNPCLMALDIVSGKANVKQNEEYVYAVRYRNIGIADVDNVLLKVSLPANVDLKDANRDYDSEGNVLFFNIGRVNKNGAGGIDIKVRVNQKAKSGDNLVAAAVLDFTDVFNDPQPNISVSSVVVVESGFFGVASALGLSFGNLSVWLWMFLIIILALIFGIFYLRYKIAQTIKA